MSVIKSAYPVPEERETSNPAGAVTVIFAVKPVAEAEKFCEVDAVPALAMKAESVPLVAIVGLRVV